MKPSQNLRGGAFENGPQPFRYHSPSPGCAIEYHIADCDERPPLQVPAAAAGSAAPTSRARLATKANPVLRISPPRTPPVTGRAKCRERTREPAGLEHLWAGSGTNGATKAPPSCTV